MAPGSLGYTSFKIVNLAGQSYHRRLQIKLCIERSAFPFLAMWSLPDEGAELVCLEPCTSVHAGGATTLNDRMGIIVLPAGDCCDKEFSVTPF